MGTGMEPKCGRATMQPQTQALREDCAPEQTAVLCILNPPSPPAISVAALTTERTRPGVCLYLIYKPENRSGAYRTFEATFTIASQPPAPGSNDFHTGQTNSHAKSCKGFFSKPLLEASSRCPGVENCPLSSWSTAFPPITNSVLILAFRQ